MNAKIKMNFYKKYCNGVDVKNYSYYIEGLEMEQQVLFFIINVIIRERLYVYIKMKKDIYLEGTHLFLGLVMENIIQPKIVLYSL
jgi:hypothetical protein